MRTIPVPLQKAYYALKKSRLISKSEIDDDSISFFEHVLNKALPEHEYDYNIYYFVKSLYYNDKSKFYNFINNTKYECLILYTDNVSIVRHFNLMHKLNVCWDKETKKYHCSKYDEETDVPLPSRVNRLRSGDRHSTNSNHSDEKSSNSDEKHFNDYDEETFIREHSIYFNENQ